MIRMLARLLAIIAGVIVCARAAEAPASAPLAPPHLPGSTNTASNQPEVSATNFPFAPDLKNTPLHSAALLNQTEIIAKLIATGADVGATNGAGATALHYGAANGEIVKLLLKAGAAPNARSVAGSTPLHIAAANQESIAAIKLLVSAGADVNAARNYPPLGEISPLTQAVLAGNASAAKFLLEHGAHPGGTNGFTPVAAAALTGHQPLLDELVRRGGAVNFDDGFAGHSLNNALYLGHFEAALALANHGASLTQTSSAGEKIPPMVWAAYSETGDPSVARMLINRGVDINQRTSAGHSALDWAKRRGDTSLTTLLIANGGREGALKPKQKAAPEGISKGEVSIQKRARISVEASFGLLQKSSDSFLRNGFVRKSACVSCHHQTLPAWAYGRAKQVGIEAGKISLERQTLAQLTNWTKTRDHAFEMLNPQPNAPSNLGYGLIGLNALGHPPDSLTAAMGFYLLRLQGSDGSWPAIDRRPPMDEGIVIGTVLAARALQLYPPPELLAATRDSLRRALAWLENSKAENINQQMYRLLGLAWLSSSNHPAVKKGAAELLRVQNKDGGWPSLRTLKSDAWATGLALFALGESGTISAKDKAYAQGVNYLLDTQFPDGSWWVKSRTWPFQPHFDTQFPHGKDQWISAGATAWASLALIKYLESLNRDTSMPVEALTFKAIPVATRHTLFDSTNLQPVAAKLSFSENIAPLLKRSCQACHSGDSPKGEFKTTSLEEMLNGGQSKEPAIIPGEPDKSPLFLQASDKIEDLEMPPLFVREKYPALTGSELQLIREWIRQGAQR